jgi:hypothetical protein
MTKLHIYNLSSHDHLVSLDSQMQQQVNGGFDKEVYNTLVNNKDHSTITYGNVGPDAFVFNIAIDRGKNNQISQTL